MLAQRASSLVWIVKTHGPPTALGTAIQTELQQASGGLPVSSIRTMDQVVSQLTATSDFNTLLMSIFGCGATLLAAIGVYGLMAYSVAHDRGKSASGSPWAPRRQPFETWWSNRVCCLPPLESQ